MRPAQLAATSRLGALPRRSAVTMVQASTTADTVSLFPETGFRPVLRLHPAALPRRVAPRSSLRDDPLQVVLTDGFPQRLTVVERACGVLQERPFKSSRRTRARIVLPSLDQCRGRLKGSTASPAQSVGTDRDGCLYATTFRGGLRNETSDDRFGCCSRACRICGNVDWSLERWRQPVLLLPVQPGSRELHRFHPDL